MNLIRESVGGFAASLKSMFVTDGRIREAKSGFLEAKYFGEIERIGVTDNANR